MTLCLLKYNNLFNKIVKREQSYTAYQQYLLTSPTDLENPVKRVNFIPGDGISTTAIVN